MRWNWKVPNAVINAVRAWLSFLTGMLWKACAASRDEKYSAPARSINTSFILGTGNESAIVTALSALKSTAQRVSPSFFATGTNGDPHGDSGGGDYAVLQPRVQLRPQIVLLRLA